MSKAVTARRLTGAALAGAALALVGVALAVSGVFARERGELDRRGEFVTLASAAAGASRLTLLRVALREGEAVLFEVCARDSLAPARWAGAATLAVWPAGEADALVEAPLDVALLSGDATTHFAEGSCVRIAEAGALGASGEFDVGVAWAPRASVSTTVAPPQVVWPQPSVRNVPLQGHVIARRPLDAGDRAPLAMIVVGALIALIALGLRARSNDAEAPMPASAIGRALLGAALLTALVFAPAVLPLQGATLVLLFALLLAAAQLVLGAALAPRAVSASGDAGTRLDTLGLGATRKLRWLALLLAPLAGVLLFFGGRVVSAVVSLLLPQTSAAAIETFVEWPSASLAVATVAVVAPVAEELFFRGFLYGSLRTRLGVVSAAAITVIAFVLPHLPQVWGAWGALAALLVTSVALTLLRVVTGSTVVPAIVHLTHNALLALLATS